jgi:hypothetical protein
MQTEKFEASKSDVSASIFIIGNRGTPRSSCSALRPFAAAVNKTCLWTLPGEFELKGFDEKCGFFAL